MPSNSLGRDLYSVINVFLEQDDLPSSDAESSLELEILTFSIVSVDSVKGRSPTRQDAFCLDIMRLETDLFFTCLATRLISSLSPVLSSDLNWL